MADVAESCIRAFRNGDKDKALRILPKVQRPQNIRDHDNWNWTLVHYAIYHGWDDVCLLLVEKYDCDPSVCNSDDQSPLHWACGVGSVSTVQYLISKESVLRSINAKDKIGDTPLHEACYNAHLPVIALLLSTPSVSITEENNEGLTPIELLEPIELLLRLKYDQVKRLASRIDWSTELLVRSYFKVFMTGNTAAGKTTLAAVMVELASHAPSKHGRVSGVETLTAGVCPTQCAGDVSPTSGKSQYLHGTADGLGWTNFWSFVPFTILLKVVLSCQDHCHVHVQGEFQLRENKKLFGRVYGSRVIEHLRLNTNIEIFDLAGQSEYYSSHAAMLESLCLESPAVFIIMVDLTKSEDQLSKEIYYWANFLEIQSSGISSHVIVVGSRKDKFSSEPQLFANKCKHVEEIANNALENQHFAGFVAVDSRQLSSENAQPFLRVLTKSINDLTISGVHKKMSFACHLLHMFLNEIVKDKATTFDILRKLVSSDSTLSRFSDPATLASTLGILANKGLLLFLRNSNHLDSSCIVIDKTRLLQEINGTLFAPLVFKEHRPIASNTGIVPVSLLHQLFQQYDRDMLVAFMTSLQFCRPVDPALLASITTNLSSEFATSEQLLYFPALVSAERPSDLTIDEGSGWFVYCTNPRKCLTRRYQDSLMLDLAYTFCLSMPTPPKLEHPNEAVVRKLNRSCTVWKNGIHWITEDGTQAMVQVTEENRAVSLSLSLGRESPAKSHMLRSSLIDKILSKQKELSSSVDVCEYLVSPSQVSLISNTSLSQLTVFEMKDVARGILLQKEFIFDIHRKKKISPESLVFSDPYQVLPPLVVQQLFASDKASELVPASLLKVIHHHIKVISIPENSNHQSLQEQLNNFSIFAGRNPLKLAGVKATDLPQSPFFAPTMSATTTSSIAPTGLAGNITQYNFQVAEFKYSPTTEVHNTMGDATFSNCTIRGFAAPGGTIGTSSDMSQILSPSRTGDHAPPNAQGDSTINESGCCESDAHQPPPLPPSAATNSIPEESMDTSHLLEVGLSLRGLERWQDLGLALGLDYVTLDSIDEKKEGNVDRCRTAMLHSWLQAGSATKSSLIAALHRISETNFAANFH